LVKAQLRSYADDSRLDNGNVIDWIDKPIRKMDLQCKRKELEAWKTRKRRQAEVRRRALTLYFLPQGPGLGRVQGNQFLWSTALLR
jgi:hypothetical protein